jgi:Uncharacterized protein SCO1/SenC/PrrC, involved in biogenesis of respiratory and photosynthetic systems
MSRLYSFIAVTLVAALLGGLAIFVFTDQGNDRFASCRTSKIAGGKAMIGGPFTLLDRNGKTVTDKDVITRPSLIYFGYTYCPDVCPMDNARNAQASELLKKMGYDVQPVFISIDPERDTPAVVGEFADAFGAGMVGLTGSPEQVKAASRAYKTYYRKNGEGEDYLMDHSTFTYLVLPKYGFVDFFRRDIPAKDMARTVACFIDKS